MDQCLKHVKRVTILIATGLILLLSACSPRSAAVLDDPFERLNRATHAFNKGLDRNLLSPVSKGYTAVVPDPVENGISNFASNLSLPGKVCEQYFAIGYLSGFQQYVPIRHQQHIWAGGPF